MGSAQHPRPVSALASAVVRARNIAKLTELTLYVRAGGRCEFDGCNRYLLLHHVTKTDGNFGEKAHICAFADGGPRATGSVPGQNKHAVENLMLLCAPCHKLVDDNPETWTIGVLKRFKKAHEDRVFTLTDTSPDRHTIAVDMRGQIAGRPVSLTLPEIQAAVAPQYLGARDVWPIDLTGFADTTAPGFWTEAAKAIHRRMNQFYENRFESGTPSNVSVFALAPIPLLMVLGSCLSDKVPTTLFQRHRDTEDWIWKRDEESVSFETARIRQGRDPGRVALLVSVSGTVAASDLPSWVDDTYSVYEIKPNAISPAPTILRTAETLREFRGEYQSAVRRIVEECPIAAAIDVFPAVPAPVAITMGRSLLPKRDPKLIVHDYSKPHGFTRTLEINDHEHE